MDSYAARPGVIIGKKGADIEKLRQKLATMTASEVKLNIVEIRKPEIDAKLVAQGIAGGVITTGVDAVAAREQDLGLAARDDLRDGVALAVDVQGRRERADLHGGPGRGVGDRAVTCISTTVHVRVDLVGNVAMDAVMADVTDVPGPPVTVDDEFVLIVNTTEGKQAVRTGIILQVDQTARIDFALQVGEAQHRQAALAVPQQFTGAAQELPEALVVNPYDIDQFAAALHLGLTMPKVEQRARMQSMRGLIQEFNVYRWAGRMLMDAARMRRRIRVMKQVGQASTA